MYYILFKISQFKKIKHILKNKKPKNFIFSAFYVGIFLF